MKTTMKIMSIILKSITVIMAIIGVVLTAVTVITTKTFFSHVDDIIDEDLMDEDEKDAIEIVSEAYGKAVVDDRVMNNPIIKIASKVFAPVVHLFWKF